MGGWERVQSRGDGVKGSVTPGDRQMSGSDKKSQGSLFGLQLQQLGRKESHSLRLRHKGDCLGWEMLGWRYLVGYMVGPSGF